ncbi:hypothetical protein L2Y96_04180 [Luteibacter aegosomaticola]|uniref:hypothetical protein n=1 Tax=Luteibacter aegosomaticola TaxID=2911538 RepID=UPI001FFAA8EF|nr:hypothetical protein [Luteibacter aegosomaticola]UPG90984.1 hypothetical protein L2Y96_04180 [Luteibacter aegosomaticola]
MSIDEALLPDSDERLSAERAYELYWAELLGEEPRFTCVGTGCHAPLTCACLKKPEQTLLIRPYYRSHRLEDHADTCEVVHGRGEARPAKGADIFEAERPANHFRREPGTRVPGAPPAPPAPPVERSAPTLGGGTPPSAQSAPAPRGGTSPAAPRPSHFYRLSSLVQKFLEHRRDKDLADAPVTIGGDTTTYEALFRNVYRQKVADHLQTRAVWWGTASLRATKEGGYYLRFTRPFRHGDELLKPTITLSAKDIDAYPVRKLLRARLDKLIAEHEGYCVVFAWARPWMPKDAEKPFVRFYIDNLDHIDVRGPDILEELKNTSRVTSSDH